MKYVGVDGCRNGWVAVWLEEKGAGIEVYHDINELWNHHSAASIILIDIPIGLVDEGDPYRERECDRLARKLLGKKSSSLFSAPSRSSLYVSDYKDASQKNFTITGKKLSKQSYYLIPKIKEVDEFLLKTPNAKPKVRESHPELCFRVLSGFQDLESKKTPIGQVQRINLIKQYLKPKIDPANFYDARAAVDDILDAFVLAVNAKLAGDINRLSSVCEERHYDSRGTVMDIVFYNPEDAM